MTINLIKKIFLCLCITIIAFSLTRCNTQKLAVAPDSGISSSKIKTVPGKMMPLIKYKISYLDSLFSAAMREAENPSPNKIDYNLRPIIRIRNHRDTVINRNLIDTIIKGEKYVKMVSWKSDPSYYKGSVYTTSDEHDIWVTAAPIIRDSCVSFHKALKDPIKSNMRLRQLLGLQPLSVGTFFLEVWVKPKDLFRPCPDQSTGDTNCELNMPETITPEHRKWFNNLRAVQYNDCSDTIFREYGYPWTQLGYTYDWSPENPTHVGLSEFVIRRNKIIYISGKYYTEKYCTTDN